MQPFKPLLSARLRQHDGRVVPHVPNLRPVAGAVGRAFGTRLRSSTAKPETRQDAMRRMGGVGYTVPSPRWDSFAEEAIKEGQKDALKKLQNLAKNDTLSSAQKESRAICEALLSCSPGLAARMLEGSQIIIWDPHSQFGLGDATCPCCQGAVTTDQWPVEPLRVANFYKPTWLFSVRLRCSRCIGEAGRGCMWASHGEKAWRRQETSPVVGRDGTVLAAWPTRLLR